MTSLITAFTTPLFELLGTRNKVMSLSTPQSVCTNPISDKSLHDHLQSIFSFPTPPSPPSRPSLPHLVLGNEAADLDSVACAVIYSFLHRHHLTLLPVVNIPRLDIQLRRDTLLALKLANINEQSLLYIDDTQINLDNPLNLTLVDHNDLAPHQSHLQKYVVGIIDHHEDENSCQTANPRIVDPVGSCATLVAELAEQMYHTSRKNSNDMSSSEAFLSPAASILLLSAVLLDCHNMDPTVGKGTARDEVVIQKLMSLAQIETKDQRDNLFSELLEARMDISNLTAIQLLRKDVKIVNISNVNVAICSVGIHPEDLVHRAGDEGVASTISTLSSQFKVDAVVIMLGFQSTANDGKFKRELLISCSPVGDYMTQHLTVAKDNFLQLAKQNSSSTLMGHQKLDFRGLHYFSQRNVKASRKVVVPMVKTILKRYHD